MRDRKEIPYVVAVSLAAHYPPFELTPEEEAQDVVGRDFKGYFNVAVETLLSEFYPVVALDIQDLPRLTINMEHDNDIWFGPGRRGVDRGVRYYVEESG
jgi:hypothetical protein